MLIDNVSFLKNKYPALLTDLKNNQEQFDHYKVSVEKAKDGSPTMLVEAEGRQQYIHSKYSPMNEAASFVDKYIDVGEYDHVLFYGVGLGYHIEAFMEKYPNMMFSIYEPEPAFIYKFLETRTFQSWPSKLMKHFYVEWTPSFAIEIADHFLNNINERVLLVIHSSYEKIFAQKTKEFSELFIRSIYNHRNSLGVNLRFERLWTLNSLLNFSKVLETQNVLREKRQFFLNKPAILVSAGPSLEEEMDNLKHIKKNGLAYIISVGSSIRALLSHGIHPDAVTAYDPETGLNGLDTYSEIVERNINTIPLLFGSSLGFNTVRQYPGPLLHMFINQDTVAPFYLGAEEIAKDRGIISDAPSVAVVTMELLAKLGANPIILAGQNFAYRNNQYYAAGISYDSRPNELLEQEMKNAVTVAGVDGGVVYTMESHNTSRRAMETYIANLPEVEILNTTQGGAQIAGTTFVALSELIEQRLKEAVVVDSWYEGASTDYNESFMKAQAELMTKEHKSYIKILQDIIAVFKKMDKLMNAKDNKQLDKQFPVFDKFFTKLTRNKYYQVYIKPMTRNQEKALYRYVTEIRETKDPNSKADKIMRNFGKFIYNCNHEMEFIEPEYTKLQNKLLQVPQVTEEEMPSLINE